MKTTSYNAAKEISLAIWFAVLTITIFTTIKVRDLQLNEVKNGNQMSTLRTEKNKQSFPAFEVADAKLVEEPLAHYQTAINSSNDKSVKELALQMESWMNGKAYWADEATGSYEQQELAQQMKVWINTSAFWSEETNTNEQDVAAQMGTWINNGAYWSDEPITNEHELASQMETWIDNGTYWNLANE